MLFFVQNFKSHLLFDFFVRNSGKHSLFNYEINFIGSEILGTNIPLKKNLFIFKEEPEIFYTEDTYLIIGSYNFIKKINLNDIENIFSIFHISDIILDQLTNQNIYFYHLNEKGEFEGVVGNYNKNIKTKDVVKEDLGIRLLKYKAKLLNKNFKSSKSEKHIRLASYYKEPLYKQNSYLDYIPKVDLIESIKSNYNVTNIRAKEISEILMNLIDNIIPLAYYGKLKEMNLDPDDGFLNNKFPSLARDLTEISRLNFKSKLIYLFKTRFFDNRDLSRKNFPDTVIKFLKKLSTYFFYSNRFKRTKEVLYFIEAYKRGTLYEVFSDL